jgi:hypothetical protein
MDMFLEYERFIYGSYRNKKLFENLYEFDERNLISEGLETLKNFT